MNKAYKKAYIEITNVCNYNCHFCPHTTRVPRFMTVAECEYLLPMVAEVCDYVYFHVMGEPLLHPQLEQLLVIANHCGLHVNLTTNGSLLEKVMPMLGEASALRKVTISLHSFESNTLDMGLKSYLERCFACARALTASGKLVELRLWNLNGEKAMNENCESFSIENQHRIVPENQLNDAILAQAEAYFGWAFTQSFNNRGQVKIEDKLYFGLAEKFDWADIASIPRKDEVFCYGLRDQFGILVDGTVVPCCLDNNGNIPLGNAYLKPLSEILNLPRAVAIRSGFSCRKAVENLCQHCGYARRF